MELKNPTGIKVIEDRILLITLSQIPYACNDSYSNFFLLLKKVRVFRLQQIAPSMSCLFTNRSGEFFSESVIFINYPIFLT